MRNTSDALKPPAGTSLSSGWLLDEALQPIAIPGHILAQHCDRDLAAEARIVREIDIQR